MEFTFETDKESLRYCRRIAAIMQELFGLTMDEAADKINSRWRGLEMIGEDLIYHETEEYWAKDIYYGHDSNWWMDKNR